MNANPVVWFEVFVSDMERAKRFYETVLDIKLERMNSPLPNLEMWTFPSDRNAGGAPGALVKIDEVSDVGGNPLIYFRCKDCAIEERRIADAGGRVHRKKTSIGAYGQISLAYDTEGNMFGLHSM